MNIRFSPSLLNLDTRQLARNGCEVHIALGAFDLLTTLAPHGPKAWFGWA